LTGGEAVKFNANVLEENAKKSDKKRSVYPWFSYSTEAISVIIRAAGWRWVSQMSLGGNLVEGGTPVKRT